MELTKIENIKELYKQVDKKTKFIQNVADELKLNAQYVRGHYFSAFWTIPEYNQDKIVEMLQKKIAKQNEPQKV